VSCRRRPTRQRACTRAAAWPDVRPPATAAEPRRAR
jgi:hypothetical protein